jgi:hypothetical protein
MPTLSNEAIIAIVTLTTTFLPSSGIIWHLVMTRRRNQLIQDQSMCMNAKCILGSTYLQRIDIELGLLPTLHERVTDQVDKDMIRPESVHLEPLRR